MRKQRFSYTKIDAFLAAQFACIAEDLFRQSHLT